MRFALLFALAVVLSVGSGCGLVGQGSRGGYRFTPRTASLRWVPIARDASEFLTETTRQNVAVRALEMTPISNRNAALIPRTRAFTHQVILQNGAVGHDLTDLRSSGAVFCALTTSYQRATGPNAGRPIFTETPAGITLSGFRTIAGPSLPGAIFLVNTASGGSVDDAVSGKILVYRAGLLGTNVRGLGGETVFYCGRFTTTRSANGLGAGITNEAVLRAIGNLAAVGVTREGPPVDTRPYTLRR